VGSRKLKEKKVEEIKTNLQDSKVIVLTDYRGLTVTEINELRRILKEEGVQYKVVKNTLTRLAVRELGLNGLEPYLQGPTAIAYGYDDPVVPVKLLVKFSRGNEHLEIKGGFLEKDILNEEELRQIARLPSRDVLLAKTLACFQAPLAGMLSVLQGNMRNLVSVLHAIGEQKEGA
jgi:large subunit ribosomal protein L10